MLSSRTTQFFIYPRDCKGNYTGNVIAVILRDGRMYHGEAICSDKDSFDKKLGRLIAYQRALEAYNSRK